MYDGTELTGASRPSNVESGLGSGASVSAYQSGDCTVSGGPFFRDIEQQGTSDSIQAYNYLWSGHNDIDSDGSFTSPAMKPGTYTQTLCQNELAVATRSVNVTAGSTVTGRNPASTWYTPSAPLFRIGAWDGTPSGFENYSNLTWMQPSDTRNASWGPVTYTVGSSQTSDFPAYQRKGVNNPTTVRFTLSSAQIAARTVRIGLTAAYAGDRPQIGVNGWTSSAPAPSTQPSSRSLTIGTYRGDNALYTYAVPASAFVPGTNTLTLAAVSGSGGTGCPSPGYGYDCVEMY